MHTLVVVVVVVVFFWRFCNYACMYVVRDHNVGFLTGSNDGTIKVPHPRLYKVHLFHYSITFIYHDIILYQGI